MNGPEDPQDPGQYVPDMPPPIPPMPPGRTGPAWEHDGPLVTRFIETLKPALTSPTPFFQQLRLSGGLGPPLTYGLLGMIVGGLIGAVLQLAVQGAGLGLSGAIDPGAAFGAGVGVVMVLLFVPIVAACALFITSALVHVALVGLNLARHPFEATFRVVAYSLGSTGILSAVPVCGGIIGALWALAIAVVGVSEVHETSTGWALVALLVPVLLCCGIAGLLAGSAVLAGLAAAFAGMG